MDIDQVIVEKNEITSQNVLPQMVLMGNPEVPILHASFFIEAMF